MVIANLYSATPRETRHNETAIISSWQVGPLSQTSADCVCRFMMGSILPNMNTEQLMFGLMIFNVKLC